MGFDTVPPEFPPEIPECPGAMNRVQKILASTFGLHRMREILDDLPLVNIKSCRQLLETVRKNNLLGNLSLRLLPRGKIRLLIIFARLCLDQKIAGDDFDLAGVKIQERVRLVGL
jgi:hypothetical protein